MSKHAKMFQRPTRTRNTGDVIGKVTITVGVRDKHGNNLQGNKMRVITVAEGKVSDVASAIEKALFG